MLGSHTLPLATPSPQVIKSVVLNDSKSLVFACTEWCGPCKSIDIAAIQELLPGVHVYKIDIEQDPDFAQKHQIRSVPTALFIRGGEVINKVVGAKSVAEYQKLAKELMGV